jgi:hypothetical protein
VTIVSDIAQDANVKLIRNGVRPEISGSVVASDPLLVDGLEEGVFVVDQSSAHISKVKVVSLNLELQSLIQSLGSEQHICGLGLKFNTIHDAVRVVQLDQGLATPTIIDSQLRFLISAP